MKARPLAALATALLCAGTRAGEATEVELRIQNHLFDPAELVVPANTKVRVRIHNLDATPEEFESWELNREKVILGGESTVIFVGPLPPGEYPFFGEFNPKTAQGKLIVQ
ncbi:MAG: hypothetical protein AMXMBFR26_00550 [Porticoccaceae bacterium]